MPSTACSEFIIRYDTWRQSVGDFEPFLALYIENPTKESFEKVHEKRKDAEVKRNAFLEYIMRLVPFDVGMVPKIEAEIAYNFLQKKEAGFTLEDNRIVAIFPHGNGGIPGNNFDASNLHFIRYLQKLREVECSCIKGVFPRMPDTLEILKIHESRNLLEITELPEGLREFSIWYDLAHLPTLPRGLQSLDCGMCSNLSVLPVLPETLTWLNCEKCTSLTALPKLPKTLDGLRITESSIRTFPALSHTRIKELFCDQTVITEIPELPDTLEELHCDHTHISTLHSLPKGLKKLICFDCDTLSTLPPLPNGLKYIDCKNCPRLSQETYDMLAQYREDHRSFVVRFDPPKNMTQKVIGRIKNIFT